MPQPRGSRERRPAGKLRLSGRIDAGPGRRRRLTADPSVRVERPGPSSGRCCLHVFGVDAEISCRHSPRLEPSSSFCHGFLSRLSPDVVTAYSWVLLRGYSVACGHTPRSRALAVGPTGSRESLQASVTVRRLRVSRGPDHPPRRWHAGAPKTRGSRLTRSCESGSTRPLSPANGTGCATRQGCRICGYTTCVTPAPPS